MTPRVAVDEDAEDMYDSLVRLNAGLGCTLDEGYIQCYTWSDIHSGWPRRNGRLHQRLGR